MSHIWGEASGKCVCSGAIKEVDSYLEEFHSHHPTHNQKVNFLMGPTVVNWNILFGGGDDDGIEYHTVWWFTEAKKSISTLKLIKFS